MRPLPSSLGGSGAVYAWRIDSESRASTWDSGIGAAKVGGRWNSVGVYAVYASLDPAAAVLEVAVHKGLSILDSEPHVITCFEIVDFSSVHTVTALSVPNPNWLFPVSPSAGQRKFGDDLLSKFKFVIFPSVASRDSWNLVFSPVVAAGSYKIISANRLALDTRLSPPM